MNSRQNGSLRLHIASALAWVAFFGLIGCGPADIDPQPDDVTADPQAIPPPDGFAANPPAITEPDAPTTDPAEVPEPIFKITCTALTPGKPIPSKHTADGDDLSPALAWSNLPQGTKELALIFDDPDAPQGTWVHWVIYKILPDAPGLPEGVPPDAQLKNPPGALQGKNSWPSGETIGYRGPSPPAGKLHRYFFKLYALDTQLSVEPNLDAQALLEAMQGHVLGIGFLMGTYQR